MTVVMRQASEDDLANLLELMQAFYAEAGYSLNPDRTRAAFLPLLTSRQVGQVWLAEVVHLMCCPISRFTGPRAKPR